MQNIKFKFVEKDSKTVIVYDPKSVDKFKIWLVLFREELNVKLWEDGVVSKKEIKFFM